jgi:hypothetical protein
MSGLSLSDATAPKWPRKPRPEVAVPLALQQLRDQVKFNYCSVQRVQEAELCMRPAIPS